MASLVPGFEYDIFVSYRQKDNKYDGWVTEFVDNLKRELEATFKEEISVYFDANPHDGLLETYDVDASLKEKLKCLIFIPIISQTYCDPKSFAWEHECKAFVEQAINDPSGLKVRLPNGNVASRFLPVRIHELDIADIQLCESLIRGCLRGVEFIYKEPGVNRPLTPADDEKVNLNKTRYRNQINKVANAVKEIIAGLITVQEVYGNENQGPELPWEEAKKEKRETIVEKTNGIYKRKLLPYVISVVFVVILLGVYVYPKIFNRHSLEKLASSENKISIAVMPFQNMTNDTAWNVWQDGIQQSLISSLANTGELKVRQKDNITTLLKNNGHIEFAAISPSDAGNISQQLDADIFIYGSIKQAGSVIRVDAQLIDTKTNEVIKSFQTDGIGGKILETVDTLSQKLRNFLLISKLIKENPLYQNYPIATNSPEAFRYCILGDKARGNYESAIAKNWYLKAVAIDSTYFDALIGLYSSGTMDEMIQGLLKLYKKKHKMPNDQQIYINLWYSQNFESLDEQIKWLKQCVQIDDLVVSTHFFLGNTYYELKQYNKAIPEYKRMIELMQKFGFQEFGGYALLGDTYHKMGQFKEEKKVYEQAESDIPDHSHFTYRELIQQQAVLAFAEKDTVAANSYILKYISFQKENSIPETEISKGIARIYWRAEIPDKAEQYFRKVLSLEAENPYMLNEFAYFLSENKGDLNEFTSHIDKAVRLAPAKWDHYNFLDTKGYGLFKLGKQKEGLEILQNIWDSTKYSFIYRHLEEVKKANANLL